jgi:MarR family transcriptional regulator, organic hydroperoxide resistance regulator
VDALAFLELLWAVDHGLRTMSKRMLKTIGVTGPQRIVIRLIGRNPGLTAKEIADQAHHHPSTLTVILRSLEKNGHVIRRSDPEDRRLVRLYLSPSGRKVDRKQKGTVEEAIRVVLGRLDSDEAGVARKALAMIVEELERASGRRR